MVGVADLVGVRADDLHCGRANIYLLAETAVDAQMSRFANFLPVQIGAVVIMIGIVILLGAILVIAGLGAVVIHLLKRRTDREFAVIGVTNDRRTIELRKRGDCLEHARADAVLDRWVSERNMNALMRGDEVTHATRLQLTPDPFRRQAD